MRCGSTAEVHPADWVFGIELFGHRAVRQGDWKIVWDQAAPAAQRRWQLFNLASDRYEQRDLSSSNPQQFQHMQQMWERYDAENGVVY